MPEISLNGIYIYPVKSLAGIKLDRWQVDDKGLLYDRKWMLIDQNNRFLSQRQLPQMALISTSLTKEHLIIDTPGMDSLSIPLESNSGTTLEARIWQDSCPAKTVSPDADQWFSQFLKIKCQLVFQEAHTIRPVDPKYAKASDKVAFSDGFPFLIISEASLASLNEAMQLNLSMLRFRPNLVISGCESYDEDSWREINIADINFRLPKPCSRCNIPNIDPDTADSGKEPLTTLSQLRKWNNQVFFGQNALHDKAGLLSVGDKVNIIRAGTRKPPLDQSMI